MNYLTDPALLETESIQQSAEIFMGEILWGQDFVGEADYENLTTSKF